MGKHKKYLACFNLRSYKYSVHLRWTFSILQCKCNILSAGNQSEGQHCHKIFHHWQVLLYTFNIAIKERIGIDNEKSRKCLFINNANPVMECNYFKILTRLEMNSFNQVKRLWIHSYTHAVSRQTFLLYTCSSKNYQNLELFLKRIHNTRKGKDKLCHQIIPIKLYTPLLCSAKLSVSCMNLY